MTDDEHPKEDNKENNEIKTKNPIFSEEEIENIVKAFISAYIDNRIQIVFPTREELKKNMRFSEPNMTDKEANTRSIKLKAEMNRNIQICCGTIKTTNEERTEAINDLLQSILITRMQHRMTGSFEDYELKKKMGELEKKLDATNNVVEQLVVWLIQSEEGYDKGPS